MWWGFSAPLDLQCEIREKEDTNINESLEVLIIGACDARHVVKTLASVYKHSDRNLTFHVIEPTLEQVARSILLISICLDDSLGLQEATRYYLEILGNTLLRPATAKYLAKSSKVLVDVVTQTIDCSWLNLEKFKHKDRDQLEWIFKFWERVSREGIPIVDYWDRRIRKSLKTRYDYREGVFDWDYHMILKLRNISNLTINEYRFWRNNGVAFTWIEGEPARSNPTLINNIIPHGEGFVHYAYLGDINNGPFFTWALTEEKNKKERATDIAEREVMRMIYEIRTREPFCEELVAAHRDSSLINGIIITDMPSNEMEHEHWGSISSKCKKYKSITWTHIPTVKVVFQPMSTLESLKDKIEFKEKYDIIWIAHNMEKQLPHVVPLLKKQAYLLIELRKYLSELREEHLKEFTEELKLIAQASGLQAVKYFDSVNHTIARFCKN